MNSIRFLRYHSPLPEYLSLIDQSTTTMNSSRLIPIEEHSPRIQSNHSVLSQVSNKIRRKVSSFESFVFFSMNLFLLFIFIDIYLTNSYKDLRRSFKEIDRNNSSSIHVKQFQEILHKYQCHLNDVQFYILISRLVTKMNGSINYNYFLQQYVKST